MAKTKKTASTKTITKKPKKEKKDLNVIGVYEETITFMCPVRGLVTQKVKVKRYRSEKDKYKALLQSKEEELILQAEGDDDGLSIYSQEEIEKEAPIQQEEE
jgi:hypothetical protein